MVKTLNGFEIIPSVFEEYVMLSRCAFSSMSLEMSVSLIDGIVTCLTSILYSYSYFLIYYFS